MSDRRAWPDEELQRFIADYEAGVPEGELLRRFPGRTVGAFRGRAIGGVFGYVASNIVAACRPCNSSKKAKRTVLL